MNPLRPYREFGMFPHRCVGSVVCLLAAVLLFPGITAAARTAKALPAVSPVRLDGRLDEAAWAAGEWQSGFFLNDASRGKSSPPVEANVQTRFKVVRSDTAVYVAVECDEPKIDAVKAATPWRDGAVWQDDCVEIFFDPANEGRYYHQVMVNSRGTIYDSYSADYGLVHSRLWNGAFRAAGVRDPAAKKWTVEVEIPFGTIVLSERAAAVWKWNVTRERHAGGSLELSSWSPLTGSFHQPKRFGSLTGLPRDYSRFRLELLEPQVDVSRTGGGVNTLRMRIGVRNASGAARRLRARASLFQDESRRVETEPFSLGAGEAKTVAFPPLQSRGSAAKTNIIFALYDGASGHLVKAAVKNLSSEYRPLRVTLLRPCYRNSIFPTERLREIEFKVQLSAQVRQAALHVRYALTDASGKNIGAGDAPVKSLAHPMKIALPANLPVGEYRLSVSAVSSGGKKQAETALTIRKLPPPPGGNEVRIDENRNVLVNGKPILAIGWYGSVPTNDPRPDVVALQNVQTPVVPILPDDGGIRKSFEEHGIYSVVSVENGRLYYSFNLWQKGKERQAKIRDELHKSTEPSDTLKQLAKELVDSVRENPGLLGYYIADEPEIHDIPSAYLENYYKYLCELDPYHPVFVTNDTIDGIVTHGYRCADVISPDPYSSEWDYVPNFLKKINEVAGPGKATYVTLWHSSSQAHTTHPYGTAPPYPYRVFRNQYFASIAYGAKGFTAYTSAFFIPEIEYRYGLPYVWRELRFLEKAICAPQSADPIVVRGASELAVWGRQAEGHLYLIAVNHKPHPCKAALQWNPLRNVKRLIVMSESREVAVRDGAVSDAFAPGDVHIYTDDPKARALPSVRSILDELAARKRKAVKPGNLLHWRKGTKVRCSNDYFAPWFQQYYYYVVNGVTDDLGWYAYRWNRKSSWLEVSMKQRATIGQVVLYTPNVQNAKIDFVDVDGSIRRTVIKDNDQDVLRLNFSPPVKCLKLRVTVTAIRNVHGPGEKGPLISEIEAYEQSGKGKTAAVESVAAATAKAPALFGKVSGNNLLWADDFTPFQTAPKYYWKGNDTKWVLNPDTFQATANDDGTITIASRSPRGYASMSHIFPYSPAYRFFQVKLDSIRGAGYKFTHVGFGVSSGAKGYRTAVNTARPGIYTVDTHYVHPDFASGKNKQCFVTIGSAGSKKNPDGTITPGPAFTFDWVRLAQCPEDGLIVTLGDGRPLGGTVKQGDTLHFELHLRKPAQDVVVEAYQGPAYSPLAINGQTYVQLYRKDAEGKVWVGQVTLGPGTGKCAVSPYPVVFRAAITGGALTETYASAAVAFE